MGHRAARFAWVCAFVGATSARAQSRLLNAGDVDGDRASEVLLIAPDGLTLLDGPDLDEVRWHLAGDTSRYVVAMAGDVDGDGLADLAVGDPGLGGAFGRVTLLFGSREVGAPRKQVLVSPVPGDGFGAGLAGFDLDGDGVSELFIGAAGRLAPGAAGWVGIHEGYRAGPGHEGGVEDLPSDGFWGLFALGASIERVFDVDGDGVSELLVSDWRPAQAAADGEPATPARGGAWLVSSGALGLTLTPLPGDPSGVLALGDLDGDDRAELRWPFASGPGAPVLVSAADRLEGAGDFNGDWVADALITGASGSRLALGAAHGQAPRVAWQGARAHPVGDVDGDGLADLAVLGADGGLVVHHGRTELLGPVAVLARPEADPTPPSPDALEVALSGGPDLDLDGLEGDLAVGLPHMDTLSVAGDEVLFDSGAVFLLPGGPDAPGLAPIIELEAPRWDVRSGARVGAALSAGSFRREPSLLVGMPGWREQDLNLGAFDVASYLPVRQQAVDTIGWQINGELGASVSLFGDLDGDGSADLAASVPGFAPTLELPSAGRVYIFPARPSSTATIARFALDGERPDARLGVLVAAGDLDGDARADLAIGSPDEDRVVLAHMAPAATKLSVRSLLDPARPATSRRFGQVLAAADFDGDGRADLAIAAPADGRVEVFRGGPDLVDERTRTLLVADPGDVLTLAACDLDGDGFGDLVVGRPEASAGLSREGRVDVYRGSASGLEATPAQRLEGGRAGARLGLAVAAFDRNHDGFCDLAMALVDLGGAPLIAVRLGNDGARGRAPRLRVRGSGRLAAVPWADLGLRDLARVAFDAGSPTPGRRTVEARAVEATGAEPRAHSALRTGSSRAETSALLEELSPDTPYRVKARLVFAAADAPLQPSSRWVRPHAYPAPGVDFRTSRNRAPVALGDRFRVGAGATSIPLDWLFDNDYDADSDELALAELSPPTAGTLRQVGDALVFEPPDGDPAEVVFTYRVRDPFGLVSEPATVTLAVEDCAVAECRDGLIGGHLELPDGKLAGFSCRVRYDVQPPRLECPVDASGALVLGSRTCGPPR